MTDRYDRFTLTYKTQHFLDLGFSDSTIGGEMFVDFVWRNKIDENRDFRFS